MDDTKRKSDAQQIIRRFCEAVGGTREELSKALGVTRQAISNRINLGDIPPVWFFRIADQYGASLDWLYRGVGRKGFGDFDPKAGASRVESMPATPELTDAQYAPAGGAHQVRQTVVVATPAGLAPASPALSASPAPLQSALALPAPSSQPVGQQANTAPVIPAPSVEPQSAPIPEPAPVAAAPVVEAPVTPVIAAPAPAPQQKPRMEPIAAPVRAAEQPIIDDNPQQIQTCVMAIHNFCLSEVVMDAFEQIVSDLKLGPDVVRQISLHNDTLYLCNTLRGEEHQLEISKLLYQAKKYVRSFKFVSKSEFEDKYKGKHSFKIPADAADNDIEQYIVNLIKAAFDRKTTDIHISYMANTQDMDALAGGQLQLVANASKAYVKKHNASLYTQANTTSGPTITIQNLVDEGFLQPMGPRNAAHQGLSAHPQTRDKHTEPLCGRHRKPALSAAVCNDAWWRWRVWQCHFFQQRPESHLRSDLCPGGNAG